MTVASSKSMYMLNYTLVNTFIGSPLDSIWGSGSEPLVTTTELYCTFCRISHFESYQWTWVIHINNVLSIEKILFDILDFWCRIEEIRFVKTLSKRRMFVSFTKISACWLLHRLIKLNKICWEKRPVKPQPNLRTSFCRRDLKNTQHHLKVRLGISRTNADSQWNPAYNAFNKFLVVKTKRFVGSFVTWSRRGKPAASARAGLRKANAERQEMTFPSEFAICSWYPNVEKIEM